MANYTINGKLKISDSIAFFFSTSILIEAFRYAGFIAQTNIEKIQRLLDAIGIHSIFWLIAIPFTSMCIIAIRALITHFMIGQIGGRANMAQTFTVALPYGAIGDVIRAISPNLTGHIDLEEKLLMAGATGLTLTFLGLCIALSRVHLTDFISAALILITGSLILNAAIFGTLTILS